MNAVMSQIIEFLVGAIVGVGEGIGQGLSSLIQNVALVQNGDTWELSAFGSFVAIFAGVSLAIGLSRWIVNFFTSLGARNE